MHGSTHFAWGAAAGAMAGILYAKTLPEIAMATGVGALAGLVPDWLQINMPGASTQIKGAFGHRGFSHWVWTPLAIAAIIRANPLWAVGALLAGWLSHIILDSVADGVPAFWPFGRLTLAHIKTGGQADKFFGGAGLVLMGLGLWTAISSHWPW